MTVVTNATPKRANWQTASMTTQQPSIVDLINGSIEGTIPIIARMGLRVDEVRQGYAAATVPIEGNGNHFGAMYAGVLFTVGEMLGGALAMATFDMGRFYPLVKDLQITFRRPATSDVRSETTMSDDEIARVAAEAEANGKSDFVLEATLTAADGTVVASTRGIYQLRAHGR